MMIRVGRINCTHGSSIIPAVIEPVLLFIEHIILYVSEFVIKIANT